MTSSTNKGRAQATRTRSSYLIWTKRILFGLVIGLIALGAVGATYQAMGARADRRDFPPPGQLYDIDGYRLHIYCTGPQDTGNPTVILETLSGGTSPDWGWVQPEIAKVTLVCSYDRAGRGWSDPSPNPITLQQTVSDLHILLGNAGITEPYVLVGHSIGGIYVRKYAAEYPNEVAGMVLVDSSHPDQMVRNPELQAESDAYLRMSTVFPTLARLGLFRLYSATGGETDFEELPAQQHDEIASFWSSPQYHASQRAEMKAEPAIFSEAHALGGLGNLPLAVVSRGRDLSVGWAKLQDELVALSSNSIHLTVDGATHVSLAFNQEDAYETSTAILQVVEAATTGQPLASR